MPSASVEPVSAAARGMGRAFGVGLFLVLAVLSCFKYLALHSTVSGLGLPLSDCYSIHYAGEWWRACTPRVRPLLLLLAQVYRLVPDQAVPFVLLTGQALVLALPAFWIVNRYGLLACLAYVLFFPIWSIALTGFHVTALLVPILFLFLVTARSEHSGAAPYLGLLPLLLDQTSALTTVCCGLYLLLVHGRRRAGLCLLVVGGLVFYAEGRWVLPFCSVSGQAFWPHWPSGSRLAQLLASPTAWFNLIVVFGALFFFPLCRPKLLVPALPALALTFAAGSEGAWTTPVTAGAAGVLFYGFCEVLGPVRILSRQAGIQPGHFSLTVFLLLALGHVLLAPSPVSRLFWKGGNFSFGLAAYAPTARDAGILAEILRHVPDDDTVAVAAQNTLNWGALIERRQFAVFPQAVFRPEPRRDLSQATWRDFWEFIRTGRNRTPVRFWQAQYVVLDTARPWCLGARCAACPGGACRDEALGRRFADLVQRARQEMTTIYAQGGFLILRQR